MNIHITQSTSLPDQDRQEGRLRKPYQRKAIKAYLYRFGVNKTALFSFYFSTSASLNFVNVFFSPYPPCFLVSKQGYL